METIYYALPRSPQAMGCHSVTAKYAARHDRFVRQSDADGYVQVLRLLEPDARLLVIFDPLDSGADHQAE